MTPIPPSWDSGHFRSRPPPPANALRNAKLMNFEILVQATPKFKGSRGAGASVLADFSESLVWCISCGGDWVVWSPASLPLRTFTLGPSSLLRYSESGSGRPPFCISQKADVWRHSSHAQTNVCIRYFPGLKIDMTRITWTVHDPDFHQSQAWIDWPMPVLV